MSLPRPRTNQPPPELPKAQINPRLATLTGDNLPQVKFQVITRENQEIVVGRVKIPHPTGHAFILRRFDTGAISLTTMIRAAYPTTTDEVEKNVCNWVRTNWDISGANGPAVPGGQSKLRLAGTWVPSDVALYLATDYHLSEILMPLVNATPDPAVSYRKSTRSAASSPAPPVPSMPPTRAARESTTLGSPTSGPASKRQRTRGSADASASVQVLNPAAAPSTPLPASDGVTVHRTTVSTVSPASRPGPGGQRTLPISPLAANGNVITADEDADDQDELPHASFFPTAAEDRADNDALIAQLSAQAPTYAPSPIKPSTSTRSPGNETTLVPSTSTKTSRKRGISAVEEPITFNPVEHTEEAKSEFERPVVRNRRTEVANRNGLARIANVVPETETGRQFFWGTFALAGGLALAFLPQLL